jgi:uncharacterized protein with HEPN domain
MKRDDSVYLNHILDSIYQIEEYTEGLNKEEFLATRLVQDGTIRQIEIIGEAIKNVSEPLIKVLSHPLERNCWDEG